MDLQGNKIYAVDFDGTLSLNARFPAIGDPNKRLFSALKKVQGDGAIIILYTCRTGADLEAAVAFCGMNGLVFDYINENLPELIELYGGDTRKINADYYIDDKNCLAPGIDHHRLAPFEYQGKERQPETLDDNDTRSARLQSKNFKKCLRLIDKVWKFKTLRELDTWRGYTYTTVRALRLHKQISAGQCQYLLDSIEEAYTKKRTGCEIIYMDHWNHKKA